MVLNLVYFSRKELEQTLRSCFYDGAYISDSVLNACLNGAVEHDEYFLFYLNDLYIKIHKITGSVIGTSNYNRD